MSLAVRLTPRASRNAFDGIKEGADGRPVLTLRVAAPPVQGAANKELIAFLADALGVRKGEIVIRSGETGRVKIVRIAGEPAVLQQRLSVLTGR